MNLSDLSREELLTLLQKIAAQPPAEATARKRGPKPKAPPSDWRKVMKVCPKCESEGHVIPHFGIKVVRGIERAQSWCVSCRANTNYYDRGRQYKTKNS